MIWDKNSLNNQHGFTLVELMVASLIALFALAGSIYIFTYQQSLLTDENDNTKVRAKGRLAIKILAREIRMAGFGLPPGGGVIDITTDNSISYRTNLDEVRTFMDSTTSGADSGDTSITILNGSPFNGGDEIVVYNPAYNDSDYVTVTSVSSGTLNFSPALTNNYKFGENAKVIYVNKYNEITIALSGNRITKQWDSGAVITLINDIEASGLVFEYYDNLGDVTTTLADVRRIGITLNMLDPKNDDAVIEFQTDVAVRNSTAKT